MNPLLEVRELSIGFGEKANVVQDISLEIGRGEIVGLAGPSGTGKSLTMWALLGLLPQAARWDGEIVVSGSSGEKLMINNQSDLAKLRGRVVSIVPQNPFTSLDPVMRCGAQIAEMLRGASRGPGQKKRILEHLKQLGFEDPERIYTAYPFELSGGQLQRIVIAMATIGEPDLILADEPTTALDVMTQHEVLNVMSGWVRTHQKSMMLVSHDIGLLTKNCDRIYEMRDGRISDHGDGSEFGKRLQVTGQEAFVPITGKDKVLCQAEHMSVTFTSRSGAQVKALHDVSFIVHRKEILGLVGATGSGKSTIAKVLTGLVQTQHGTVVFEGKNLDYAKFPELRKHVQMIFQDPYSALYPHWTVSSYLLEAVRLHRRAGASEPQQMVIDVLGSVGLGQEFMGRYPYQLSGGERQRVQIARSLLIKPLLLICDEITSGLDNTVQTQVLDLLLNLKEEHEMAMLIISHDLAVIRKLAQRVLVISEGHIVEEGDTESLFENPQHPSTRALLGMNGI